VPNWIVRFLDCCGSIDLSGTAQLEKTVSITGSDNVHFGKICGFHDFDVELEFLFGRHWEWNGVGGDCVGKKGRGVWNGWRNMGRWRCGNIGGNLGRDGKGKVVIGENFAIEIGIGSDRN
jgi:hypothetical protein